MDNEYQSPRSLGTDSGGNTQRDKSIRIKGMGVVQLVLGGLTALLFLSSMLAVVVQQTLTTAAGGAVPNQVSLWMSVILYGLAAAFFIWLGVGSLRLRRWTQPIVLSIMWPTVIIGLVVFIGSLFITVDLVELIGQLDTSAVPIPRSVVEAVIVFTLVLLFVIYVVIPGVHVLAYRGEAVRQTLRSHDEQERWTDNCPTRVLGLAVWLVLTGVSLLAAAPMRVLFVFGILLKGGVAIVAILVLAGCAVAAAWLTYRQRRAGWWVTLAFFEFLCLSSAHTFIVLDLAEFYRQAGLMPADQIEQIGSLFDSSTPWVVGFFVLNAVAAAAYMMTVRKYFKPTESTEAVEPGAS